MSKFYVVWVGIFTFVIAQFIFIEDAKEFVDKKMGMCHNESYGTYTVVENSDYVLVEEV